MKHLITGLVLSGLALFSFASDHYPPHAKSTRTDVTVHVRWIPDHATLDLLCAFLMDELAEGRILACFDRSTTTIYAVEPSSFNDLLHLSILGHEFWHALGAEHPAP